MGAATVAAVIVFTICLQNSLTRLIQPRANPKFPSFRGDITATGTMESKGEEGEVHFNAWLSERERAARFDTNYEEDGEHSTKTLLLEKEGSYGRVVQIDSTDGTCEYQSGTASDTYRYVYLSFILTWGGRKYLGKETVDGVSLDKWEFNIPDAPVITIYAIQAAGGPVPTKLIVDDLTVKVSSFSSAPISAEIFQYDSDGCTEMEEVEDDEPIDPLNFLKLVKLN